MENYYNFKQYEEDEEFANDDTSVVDDFNIEINVKIISQTAPDGIKRYYVMVDDQGVVGQGYETVEDAIRDRRNQIRFNPFTPFQIEVLRKWTSRKKSSL